MNEKSITTSADSETKETTGDFEKFDQPYWGDTPKLTPEQIVEWLEGRREMMMLMKESAQPAEQAK
jgi:hypothetical protein